VAQQEAGPAFHLPDGRPLSLEEVGALASRHRFVLVGEVHDSPCDHRAQVEVIDALVSAGTRPVVALESVAVDRQEALDRFASGAIDLQALERALDWEGTWGYPFELTAQVFTSARRHDLPLAALNLPNETIRQLGREGLEGISPPLREQLPRIVPPPPAQVNALREVWRGHGASARGFDRFVLVQSAWDSQMAERAIARSRALDRQVVILAGAGHVLHGWGIPHRLRTLLPGASVLTIVPASGGPSGTARPVGEGGDLLFTCPMQPGRGGASFR
jgi:uncharacterized iron-regulated protein